MPRRKESGFDVVAGMPWPAGIALGLLAYIAIRFALPAFLLSNSNPVLKGLDQHAAAFAPFAWIVLAMCWLAAAASFVKSRHRKRLLETQTGLDSIAAMSWREFEMLVGEAFRRQGYSVDETGLGGADGGIDLIVRKNGRLELVQCKQWRSRKVTPAVVREMWGLVDHHRAAGVKIVCVGEFTPEAKNFADGKAIELINGEQMLSMIRNAQGTASGATLIAPAPSTHDPLCPACGESMVLRTNRHSAQQFWGCAAYPQCKATRTV